MARRKMGMKVPKVKTSGMHHSLLAKKPRAKKMRLGKSGGML